MSDGRPRIAVLRALMLGDMVCATPALRALAGWHGGARLTLIGLPWAAGWAARLPYLDDFLAFPGWPGLPEQPADAEALLRFRAQLAQGGYDRVVQMHGSGRVTNPMLRQCGVRRLAGFVPPESAAPAPDELRWPEEGSEVDRMLALARHLGCSDPGGGRLDHPLTEADRAAAAARWPRLFDGAPYIVVHPGARWASRRWPAERFAAVAARAAEAGWRIVLTGSAAERVLADEMAAAIGSRSGVDNLAGETDLWLLGAVIERAAAVLCNDTGVSHVAAAVGTPSTVVASGSDVARWAPADAARHRVLWAAASCRPCAEAVCPTGHECAAAVGVEPVWRALRQRLERGTAKRASALP